MQVRADIPCVILAGGKASRMGGGDKGLLPWQGGTILDALVGGLDLQTTPLALNANGEAGRFARFGLPVLPDAVPDQPGPLAGVLTAMDWAAALGASAVLTVPCDSPQLPPDLVERLAAARPPGQAAMAASSDGTLHPVITLWPATAAPSLRGFLARGDRRVRQYADELGMVAVPFDAQGPDPFLNINRPGDLDPVPSLSDG